MKKVTIQDIAAQMNMSRNTVAKALNGGDVSPHTRMAVVQKAWQMGYAKIDSALLEEMENNSKRMNVGTILVLFKRWDSVFWNRMIEGISSGLNKEGYRMQLQIVEDENEVAGDIRKKLSNDVKGIIFLTIFPIEFVREIAKSALPITFFNTPVNGQEYIKLGDVISVDGFYSMSELTAHIIESRGCRILSFIGNAQGSRAVQARYLGYLSGLRKYGLEPDEDLQFTNTEDGQNFTYGMVEKIINDIEEMPDAFVCENDDIAEYVSLALVQKEASLARTVVVAGFDNTLRKDFFKKDILSVDVHVEEIGRRLVRSVLERVDDPSQDIAFITVASYPLI